MLSTPLQLLLHSLPQQAVTEHLSVLGHHLACHHHCPINGKWLILRLDLFVFQHWPKLAAFPSAKLEQTIAEH
jgi:hypothetical protein